MATNLLIGDAGLVIDGATPTLSVTASTTYPLANLFGGNKTDRFQASTAASGDTRVTFTGTGALSADFLYLGGALTLQKNFVNTITLKRHTANNYAAGTTVSTLSSFTTATLVGPAAEDYVTTFTSASAQYWFVNYNATSASKCPHQKLFLGASFDPGRDPNAPMNVTRLRPGDGQRKPAYRFSLTWEGLTYAKAVTMWHRFYRNRRHSPVVLFTTDYHPVLNGAKVLFGRILEMTAPPRVTDYCDVSMVFEELP